MYEDDIYEDEMARCPDEEEYKRDERYAGFGLFLILMVILFASVILTIAMMMDC